MSTHLHRPPQIAIRWSESIDAYMTEVESSDPVLSRFFRIDDWTLIRHIFQAVADEDSVEYEQRGIFFGPTSVTLCMDEMQTQLERSECLRLFHYLFDLMIVGANDDHHGVRYEPWWQEFTEASYRLKYKIDLQNRL